MNDATPQTAVEKLPDKSPMSVKLTQAPKYYWFIVAFLVLMSALGSFVNDMYTPALPAMCHFFGCQVPVAQMGLTMGMIGLAVGQLILGPMSDRYGRKPVLIGSVSIFILAAIASIYSPNIHVFNLCRLFQGIGASGGYFLARTIPADIYSGRPLAKLMAVIGAINGFAPASAPVIGGITADAYGWKGIFVVLSIFALIILLITPFVKESLSVSRRTQGPWWKSMSGYIDLLHNRPFVVHVCFKGLALGLLFAYVSSSPFILQTHYGLSQTVYGLVIGFNSLFVMTGSLVALKFKPLKKAAVIGEWIMTGGVAAQAVALYTIHNIWIFEICMAVILLGLGLIFTTSNSLAMNEGRNKAGDASALLGVSGYVVGAIVAPAVGFGNILHSTAITYILLSLLVLVFAHATRKIAPDLDNDQ